MRLKPTVKTVSGWHYDALCALPENRNLPWFPDDEPASFRRSQDRKVIARLCNACPVQVECRSFAEKTNVTAGIWAGRMYGSRA